MILIYTIIYSIFVEFRILIQDARFGGPYNRLVFQFDS